MLKTNTPWKEKERENANMALYIADGSGVFMFMFLLILKDLEILSESRPIYWLLEATANMKAEYRHVLTNFFEVSVTTISCILYYVPPQDRFCYRYCCCGHLCWPWHDIPRMHHMSWTKRTDLYQTLRDTLGQVLELIMIRFCWPSPQY